MNTYNDSRREDMAKYVITYRDEFDSEYTVNRPETRCRRRTRDEYEPGDPGLAKHILADVMDVAPGMVITNERFKKEYGPTVNLTDEQAGILTRYYAGRMEIYRKACAVVDAGVPGRYEFPIKPEFNSFSLDGGPVGEDQVDADLTVEVIA